ncbi:MAG: DUF423 domain-containing protein [Candidatus Omnitrophica bacterium]|nr:DUF423 domain-containing protein [Candidatus Omnitrophota bacterium]
MIWAKLASLLLFLGVAFGAFGAHALRDKLSPHALDIFKTAVLYHMLHALGLFAIAWISTQTNDPRISWAGWLLTFGIVFFSGSLYLLAMTDVKILGAITPLGGLAFLAGWLILFLVIK